jgi:hypothetical protein
VRRAFQWKMQNHIVLVVEASRGVALERKGCLLTEDIHAATWIVHPPPGVASERHHRVLRTLLCQ